MCLLLCTTPQCTIFRVAIGLSLTEGAGAEKGGAGTLQLTKSLWEQQSTFLMGATLWEQQSTDGRLPHHSPLQPVPFSVSPILQSILLPSILHFVCSHWLPRYIRAKCNLASCSLFIPGIRSEREKLLLSFLTASPHRRSLQ